MTPDRHHAPPNGGYRSFGGLLLRRQELTLGTGSARQELSGKVRLTASHLSRHGDGHGPLRWQCLLAGEGRLRAPKHQREPGVIACEVG
jgi:hypothetical protein